jgi:hypothetical protein
MKIDLPPDVVRAIEAYNATNWDGGSAASPDSLAALNAVAFIGERVAAICKAKRRRK